MNLNKKLLKTGIAREKQNLPFIDSLIDIILAPTEIGKSGYPIIAEKSYLLFLNKIPHLFQDGSSLLEILKDLEFVTKGSEDFNEKEKESIKRAISVLSRVTLTAAVTSPSDLWLLRQVISSFKKLEIDKIILSGNNFSLQSLSKDIGLDKTYLSYNLSFLHSRGLLKSNSAGYQLAEDDFATQIFQKLEELDLETPRNMIPLIVDFLVGGQDPEKIVESFFSYSLQSIKRINWIANINDIELGFRLLPLVLACRSLEIHNSFKEGVQINSIAIKLSKNIRLLLIDTGAIEENNKITALGERMFSRGPGPYGIIHAYYSYMQHHSQFLLGKKKDIWVARGENVAASQDANAKTFKQINSALDSFCKKYSYHFSVYIEHAVGQGEASRQRFEKDGEENIQYFGADLEDSAIDKAIESQNAGHLAKNMKFIRNADIGKPEILIKGVEKENVSLSGSVMVVGNGFHEVRNQSNQKMLNVFKGYADAEIILAFTEESGLSDEDLLYTGWNTYHAGFRFVHDISGQGLRPAIDNDNNPNARYSWKKCATLAGYEVMEEFTTKTRTVYPHPRKNGYNPSISVSYFCVPKTILEKIKNESKANQG